ncbi:hypothetical protein [Aquamicrobium zhengzhouense]|uniref:Uncharacterized protein n=1 Tax=Aquamicrobium zhengzhouense TaxID=2781738 RepID=A0ABS0SA63_9HYPH|nr:hypothetical protein [Aquamicrobium zhengzhouense]MBI1620137.1 hypothetical protein [Aquamicrobium zhengzhouense]
MSTLLPIIEQMYQAEDDRARARILLQCPDIILLKYRELFEAACRRAGFDLGLEFIELRRVGWHEVRGPDGRRKGGEHELAREAFARFSCGEIG